MIKEVKTASTYGIEAYIITVEIHLERAINKNFSIVGLPDSSVKEARDRVTAAIKNSGYDFPSLKKVTINLSPADIKKEGTSFDLPLAVSLLTETGQIKPDKLKDHVILGELSLDGKLRRVPGILPITIEARNRGFKGIIVPSECVGEAAVIPGINVYPVESLKEVVDFLNGKVNIQEYSINTKSLFDERNKYILDFSDVKGQDEVKRALEVAAAGGHNLIMIGLPGSGKSMLAKRLPTILPPMTLEESLETTKIHSIAGILSPEIPLVTVRPFRSPHHTASDVAIVGGGTNARPGEISFAHNGVLFLDEMTEFKKNVLEVLRQPLEEGIVSISRAKMSVKYPCNFMLIGAMNPTPAGSEREMSMYSDYDIQKFLSKISGPILDRIDIHIHVNPVKYDELSNNRTGEDSAKIRERVVLARNIQLERFKEINGLYSNAKMSTKEIRKYCVLNSSCEEILKTAMTKFGLSARAYDKILKLSRTIADLDNKKDIEVQHISEAVQYRSLDRTNWI